MTTKELREMSEEEILSLDPIVKDTNALRIAAHLKRIKPKITQTPD